MERGLYVKRLNAFPWFKKVETLFLPGSDYSIVLHGEEDLLHELHVSDRHRMIC